METAVQDRYDRYVVKAIPSKTGKTSRPSVVDTETGEEVLLLKRGREHLAERAARDLNDNIGKPHFEPGDRVVTYGLNGPRFGIIRRPEVGDWLRPSWRGYRGAEYISSVEFLFGESQWSNSWVVAIERANGEVDERYTTVCVPLASFLDAWYVVDPQTGGVRAGGHSHGVPFPRERVEEIAREVGERDGRPGQYVVVRGTEVAISE
jgi:hypothetical protein